ncbi:hypothetical protein CEXT_44631 [Caerostris extrusa]|uniref:Uncharacterized protein n=1 Tax=Caerostris extrusa TaxID=172846 RepID=A0AAV4QMI2_CAEEX|nr:hypothetical protein CEXT_44631 [Caerostris extrusa]
MKIDYLERRSTSFEEEDPLAKEDATKSLENPSIAIQKQPLQNLSRLFHEDDISSYPKPLAFSQPSAHLHLVFCYAS